MTIGSIIFSKIIYFYKKNINQNFNMLQYCHARYVYRKYVYENLCDRLN